MLIWTALCLVLCSATGAYAQCRPTQYRAGATFADSPSLFVRNISIPLQDFTPSKLVCLAGSFKGRYRDRSHVMVNIFSSHKAAASNSIVQQETTKADGEAFAQLHAQYIFDAAKHEEYVQILPAGVTPGPAPMEGPYSTRIDLLAATTPHCHLEINNRCLIALERITYPDEALKAGAVTLSGIVTPSGTVNRVRVVKTESVPPGAETMLANAAAKNLSSWRVEPGPHQDEIRITYSYLIDNSLHRVDGTQVQWALPNEVMIRGNPDK